MKRRNDEPPGLQREQAEQRLAERSSRDRGVAGPPLSDAALVHELQIHQIELEMQNEELARAHAEAEVARERYAELYDFAPVGYFTVSRDSTIHEVNLTGARLLGLERSLLVERRLLVFIAPRDRAAFSRALSAAIGRDDKHSCDVTLGDESGAARAAPHLQLTISSAPGSERLRVVAVDATERKRSEDSLRTSQKLEAIGRLAGGVAHDFNNLLTVILSNADVALEGLAEDSPARENIAELRLASERAAALTRQLLAFSRKQVVEPEVVDVNCLVRKTASMLARLIGEDVVLELVLADDLAAVEIDPTQLDQVIMNLSVNARDAMPGGGTLTIATANLDEHDERGGAVPAAGETRYVRLTVSDTGDGMDAAMLERIFEPFFTTKDTGHGTGLGLSTVFGIVKQCGGRTFVRSEPGRGTTFDIDLPRSVALPAARATSADARARASQGTETILVVEDEPALLRVTVRILRAAGYTVLGAANGPEALRLFREHSSGIHLALSDIVMPEMSGVTFGEQLRAVHPDTKILHMSGYAADALAARHGGNAPGVRLLNKPFTPEQLRRAVRELLDSPPDFHSDR